MSTIKEQGEAPKKKVQIVQPFQLFCMQNRVQTAMMNPNLKGTGVTSLLAKKWRALDQNSREYFEQLSLSIRQNSISEISCDSSKPNQEKKKLDSQFYLPRLFLESRNNFGAKAVETSKKLSGLN